MKNNIENNKLIARFMGYQVYPDNNCDTKPNKPNSENSVRGLEFMFQDWNELMSVVKKIEKHHYRKGRYFYLKKEASFVQIKVDRMNVDLFSQWGTSGNIDTFNAIYRAVVEFIKWHNSANENTTDQLSNTELGQSTII